jgi:hypothetical protein
MWEPQLPATLRDSTACTRITLLLHIWECIFLGKTEASSLLWWTTIFLYQKTTGEMWNAKRMRSIAIKYLQIDMENFCLRHGKISPTSWTVNLLRSGMTLCCLVKSYWCFWDTYCFHPQGRRMRQAVNTVVSSGSNLKMEVIYSSVILVLICHTYTE